MHSVTSPEPQALAVDSASFNTGRLFRGLLVALVSAGGVIFVAALSGAVRLAGLTDPRAILVLHVGVWSLCLSQILLSLEAARRPTASLEDLRNQSVPVALSIGWFLVLGSDVAFVLLQLSSSSGAAIVEAIARLLIGQPALTVR